jgi:hypothetical protein
MILGLIQVRKIQTVSRVPAVFFMKVNSTGSVVRESEQYELGSDFCNLLYLIAWGVQDLHFSV